MKKMYPLLILLIALISCKKTENTNEKKSSNGNSLNYTITERDKVGGFEIVNNDILLEKNKFGIIKNGTDIVNLKGSTMSSYDGKFLTIKGKNEQKLEMSRNGKFVANNKTFSWDDKGNFLVNDTISGMKITPPNSEYYISASSILYLYLNFTINDPLRQ